jgi:hypothetical protein
MKAACGLAYRPQAAFAFDRYLSSNQLLVWLHDDGYAVDTRPKCSINGIALCGGVCNTFSAPYTRNNAPALAAYGLNWRHGGAQAGWARQPNYFSSGTLPTSPGQSQTRLNSRSDPHFTHEPRMHVPGLLFF